MIRLIVLLSPIVLASCSANDEQKKAELARLQGVWIEARPGAAPLPDRGVLALVFTEDRIVARHAFFDPSGQVQKTEREVAQFTIDPSSTPKSINMRMLSDPNKDALFKGSYLLDDDRLELLMPGTPDDSRPTTKEAAKQVLYFVRPSKLPEGLFVDLLKVVNPPDNSSQR